MFNSFLSKLLTWNELLADYILILQGELLDDEEEELIDIKEEIYKDTSSTKQATEIRQGKNKYFANTISLINNSQACFVGASQTFYTKDLLIYLQ